MRFTIKFLLNAALSIALYLPMSAVAQQLPIPVGGVSNPNRVISIYVSRPKT